MKKEFEDRRIRKTKKALYDALIALLFEKGFDEIVVKDILDRADVGRSTFYMHFDSKESLFMSGFGNLVDELREAQVSAGKNAATPHERVLAFSTRMFEHAYEARTLFQAIRRSRAGEIAMRRVKEILDDVIIEAIEKEKLKQRSKSTAVPASLVAPYLSASYVTVLIWWIDQSPDLPPKEADRLYRALVLPSLDQIFK